MNIKELIGEATEYDKKLTLEVRRPKSWCKSVSAFANSFGGTLIFGISNEGQLVGVEDPEGILIIRQMIMRSPNLGKGIRSGQEIVLRIKI